MRSLLAGIPKLGREHQSYLFIYRLNLSYVEGVVGKNDLDWNTRDWQRPG